MLVNRGGSSDTRATSMLVSEYTGGPAGDRDPADSYHVLMRTTCLPALAAAVCAVSGTTMADPPDAPAPDANAPRINEIIQVYAGQGRFQGSVLVAIDGEVVYRKAFGLADVERGIDNTLGTRHGIGSLAKSFTAAIILQLVDEGRLDLETTVAAYLPEFRSDYAERITLDDLLSHRSGVRSEPQSRIDRDREGPYTLGELVRLANKNGLLFEPGTRYRYSDIGYNLLAAIIEQTEGKPFDTVLHERIFDPLGMGDTGLVCLDPNPLDRSTNYIRMAWGDTDRVPEVDESFAVGAGGMYSTVDDLYLWNRALDGGEMLSKESRTRMFTAGAGIRAYGWGIGTYNRGDGKRGDGNKSKLAFAYSDFRGPSTAMFRLVDDGHLVVLLGNVRQVPLAEIATNLASLLVGAPLNPAAPPLEPLYEILMTQGVDAAVERFAGKPGLPREAAINQLGYQLMNRGRLDAALRVFQFNVAAYPKQWNTYDSLAEGYMEAGDYLTATRYYNLSLDLNPGNTNGKMMLQRLESQPGPF